MYRRTLIIAAVSIISCLLLYSCFSEQETKVQSTVKVSKGNMIVKALAVGNIIPRHSITITSPLPGIVASLFHYEGDNVKAGASLLQISPNPKPHDLAEAKRDVERKLINEQTAHERLMRRKELLVKGIIHKDEFAVAEREYKSAEVDRKSAEDKLSLLQKGESTVGSQTIKSIITSPIDGVILTRLVEVGDSIVPQTDAQRGNVLFVIADMTNLIFSGQVSESDAGKIYEGMPAILTIGALPGMTISGKVGKISLQSDNLSFQKNTNPFTPFLIGYKLEIVALNVPKNIRLRSGYSATADIIINQLQNVLLVPERVLIFRNNKVYVKLQGNPPVEKEIRIGATDGINAQVLSGLKEGDIVIDNIDTGNKS